VPENIELARRILSVEAARNEQFASENDLKALE
jgi:hypothetical protein